MGKEKKTKNKVNEFNKLILKNKNSRNNDLFKKHFSYHKLTGMLKAVYDIKNTKKNNESANLIKSELSDLKNEIEEMSENEIKTEQPNAIVNVVEKIVDFNNQNQTGQGLKVLTPDQMLSRLPITLAQLQAVNNSEKLKNQIKQLLYSMYRSKKLTEIIYKHLININ